MLPIRQFDAVIVLTDHFAAALTDLRHQSSVRRDLREMVRSREFGILADFANRYENGRAGVRPAAATVGEPKSNGDLELIALSCLQKSPVYRYATAAYLASDLKN